MGGVQRLVVIDQLGEHVFPPEPVHQTLQRGVCRGRPFGDQGVSDGALAAAGQHHHVPGQIIDQGVDVIDRAALLPAGQLRPGNHPTQPVIALLTARDHQQMLPDRVCDPTLRGG